MPVVLWVIVSVVALSFVGMMSAATARILRHSEASTKPQQGIDVVAIKAEVAELRARVEALPSLWEHERTLAQEAKREATEQHRKAARARSDAEKIAGAGAGGGEDERDPAQRYLEEHAELGEAEGVLPLRPGVAGDVEGDISERAKAAGWSPLL